MRSTFTSFRRLFAELSSSQKINRYPSNSLRALEAAKVKALSFDLIRTVEILDKVLGSPSPLVFAGSVSANLLCIKRTIYASFGCNLAVERKSNAALPVVSMARNVVSLRSSVIAFQLSLFCENLHGTLDHIEARNL